jgi:hypothetical protein
LTQTGHEAALWTEVEKTYKVEISFNFECESVGLSRACRKIFKALMQVIMQLDGIGITSILQRNRHSGLNHMNLR